MIRSAREMSSTSEQPAAASCCSKADFTAAHCEADSWLPSGRVTASAKVFAGREAGTCPAPRMGCSTQPVVPISRPAASKTAETTVRVFMGPFAGGEGRYKAAPGWRKRINLMAFYLAQDGAAAAPDT